MKRIVLLVSLMLTASCLLATPPSAAEDEAAPPPVGELVKSQRYSSYRYAWIPQFKMCAGVYVVATIKADVTFTPIEGGAYATIHTPRVVDPYMLVTLKKSCDDNAALKRKHGANFVGYNNYFYGYKCSYNPSFSVAFPWSIGVGVTPDCGDEKVARHGDRQPNARRAYRFEVSSDGYAFRWNQQKTHTQPAHLSLCTSVAGYLSFRDTEGQIRKKALKKVGFSDACVRYDYNS